MTTIPFLSNVTCADLNIKNYEGRWTQEEANSHQKYGMCMT